MNYIGNEDTTKPSESIGLNQSDEKVESPGKEMIWEFSNKENKSEFNITNNGANIQFEGSNWKNPDSLRAFVCFDWFPTNWKDGAWLQLPDPIQDGTSPIHFKVKVMDYGKNTE